LAVFWRGANLRHWLAAEVEPLSYGRLELWLAPVFTMMAAAALASSLVLLRAGAGARAGSGGGSGFGYNYHVERARDR
jgi:hypothetical protein